MNSRPSPTPQDVVFRPPSATQDNEEVDEEMFKSSCSISASQSEAKSTASSTIPDKDSPIAGAEPIAVDDEGDTGGLQYPSSPLTQSSQMDVDEDPIQEISSVTSKPSGSPVSRAHSALSISAAPNNDAIATTSFYAADPPKSKGKEKATLGPFPFDGVEVTNSEDDEHKVDEILAERESSDQPEHPTYVFMLTMLLFSTQLNDVPRCRTFIFTLDSLGSRHPQAINCLCEYLKMEAKDKKGIEHCSDAKGVQASVSLLNHSSLKRWVSDTVPYLRLHQVPFQPNFSDCGLYVLHLTKTFMRRPDYHCKTIRVRLSFPSRARY